MVTLNNEADNSSFKMKILDVDADKSDTIFRPKQTDNQYIKREEK
jgi:hypothetical protein